MMTMNYPMPSLHLRTLLALVSFFSLYGEGVPSTTPPAVSYIGAEAVEPAGLTAIGNALALGDRLDAYIKSIAPDLTHGILVSTSTDGVTPNPDLATYVFDVSAGKRQFWIHLARSDRGEMWVGPLNYDENGAIVPE